MALSFPSSPSNGDTVTAGNITWTFNSSKGVWQNNVIGLSGASITIAADSGSDDLLTLGEDTLTIAGGTGLTSTVSDNQISIALDNTAVSAGQYGASNAIPQITVDAQGRVTSIATVDNTPTAEIGVEDSIMAATEIVSGTAYVIKGLGNTNWVSLGATSVTAPNLVNGTQYIITSVGNTTNWTAVGADNTPAVGEIFTANTTGATGNGTGTALQTAFTASGNGSGTGTVMLNSTHFVTFVDSRTGTSDIFASSAMTYNPGTNTFQAGNVNGSFSGSFSGEFAGTFTGVSSSASVAQTISIVNNAGDDESMFLILADGNSGVRNLEGSSGLFYNPNSTILTSPKFAGALTGNVTGQVSTLTNHDTSGLSEDSNATVTSGTMYYTDARVATKINSYVTGSTGITVTNGSVSLNDTTVTGTSYGSASEVPTYTVDAQGRLTEAANVTIAIPSTQITDFTTAVEATLSVAGSQTGDGSLTYDNTTGVFTYTGPSASETRAHITGGTGVTITNGSIAIDQSVATTANVEFNQVTADLVGNADTATSAAALTTAVSIGGVSFDGSESIPLPGVNATGNQNTTGNATTATTATTAGSWTNAVNLTLTGAITGTASVQGTGNVTLDTSLGGTSGTVTIGAGTDSTQDLSFSTSGARLDIDGTANEIDATVSKTGEVVTVQLGLPSDVTIGNNLSVTNDFSVATNKFTVDGTTGNTVIAGNLTIQGTTTTVDSNTVNIGDNIIVLNADEDGTPSQNAGIEIERGNQTNASFLWDEANDYWTTGASHGLNVPALTATNITGNVAGNVTGNVTGDVTGNVLDAGGNSVLSIATSTSISKLSGKADRAIQVLTNESTAATLFPVAFFNTGGTTEDQTFGQASAGTFKTTLTDSDTLKYQPSTGTLYASNFSGNVAGSSSSASTVAIGQEFTSSSDHFLTFVNSSDAGNRSVKVDSLLKFVPGTNTLYSTNFNGALSGNATTASALDTAKTITLGGNLTGSVSFDGSANVTLTATLNAIALDQISAGTVQISSETFADNDFTIMTSAAIQDKIAADIATYNYSTTTGTVTNVGGGAGLTGSITTTGALAVGAGTHIIVNTNDIAVDVASANTANKIVARDSSGNFSAGIVTADLVGDVTGNVTGNVSGSSGTVSSLSGLTTANLSENTNLYYTDDRVQTKARALLEHSNHVGATVAFDSTSDELEITVTSSSNLSLQDASNADSSHFLTFAAGADGSEAILTDSGLTYNPSSNILSATSFSGGWSGTTIPVAKGGTGLTSVAADQIIYTTGADTFGSSDISSFGRTIIDDADASAARTTLGIGSIATQSYTSVNIDGGAIDGTIIGGTTKAAGSFTTINATGTITGNLSGNVTGNVSGTSGSTTGNAATATALATAQNFSITGDVTASAISFNGTSAVALNTTLATTMNSANAATTPGTFGSGTTIPQITVDAKGRVTSVATVAASSSSSQTISDGTNTDAVTAGTDTLTFSGGEGITTAVTNNQVTISAELATASNKGVASFDTTNFSVSGGAVTINPERVQDIVGAMVSSNTESGITVVYQDDDGTLDFDVNDFTITLGNDLSGNLTITDLAGGTLNATIADNAVALGTKTTGNYVATIADAGNSHITVANSGSESAAVTLNIADSAIDTDQIATDAVTLGTKTTGNYVATIADAGNSAITVANSGTETAAVTLDIAAEGVGTAEIENLAVTSAKLADDAVTNAKLDSTTNFEAVNSDVIRTGAITTVKIADDAVTSAKLDTNIQIAGNLTVDGNLTVSGTRVQVDVETLSVEDSLIDLARNNSTTDAVDIGLYGLYDTTGSQDVYGGLFRDASDSGKWKLFKDLQTEPTSTVLVTGTGYTTGTLVADIEGNVTGDVTGAATKVTVIADNNTNSTNNITFVNAASGDRQVRTDNQLTYNPSTGTLAAGNIQGSLFGNLVGNVTGNISGNVTGTITGDTSGNSGTATALQNSRNFTVGSTDVAFDGSADADLTEAVQDTVGAMFSSNTENGVTVTYADVDGTIDLTATALYNGTTKQLETTSTGLQVFGTILPDATETYDLGSPTKRFRRGYFDEGTIFLGTQELTADSTGISVSGNFTANNITGTLTGNATGTASSLATSRNITIGSVAHAFDGSADVDLTEAIQDTVGAMFSSNTETNITATYQDSDGTIDLAVTAASSAGGVTSGGSVVTTSDSAPSSPNDGALWFDTTGLKMYVYYADGSSSQWVESTPGAGASSDSAAVSISETGPSNPDEGALWFDPSNLTPYIYYNDGNSSQWVELTPAPSGAGGSGVVKFAEQAASATLVAGNKKIVDTSSSAITLTLPGTASIGDEVHIIDGTGNASTNNITIARNGHKIQGAAENLIVSTDRAAFQLVYYNANNGWVLINR